MAFDSTEKHHRFSPLAITRIAAFGCILWVVLYAFIYYTYPFEGGWNDILLNAILSTSAMVPALTASVIYLIYQPDDAPRAIWLHLAIGCWLWFFAEVTWSILNYQLGEVPTPSFADVCWVLGFVFFTFAFYRQYRLVYPGQKSMVFYTAIAVWVIVLLLPLVALTTTGSLTLSAYIDYFYPPADFAVGIAGLALVFVFRGGMLTRSWVGLMVFGISDLLYAWAEQSGLYAWSAENNSMLTLGIDVAYLAAYLILAIGFIGHWALLHYGLNEKK